MTTQKTVLVVLEDCVIGANLAGGLRHASPANLLSPGAPIGKFPGNGDPLAELIARGHRVVVASQMSYAALSTAVYLYDLEYHHLETFGGNPFTDDRSYDIDALAKSYAPTDVLVVANPQNIPRAVDPKTFFGKMVASAALGRVTVGKRKVSTNSGAPAAPAPEDALYDLHTELVRPGGWRLQKLDALAMNACSANSAITRVRAAYWTLDAAPGVPSRSVLQDHLLRGVAAVTADPKAFYVFDPSRHVFHFYPHLLTRREYRANSRLRSLYLAALADFFPNHAMYGDQLHMKNVRAVTPYASRGTRVFGSVMGVAKDWKLSKQSGSNGISGANVALSYLPFAAELMAARSTTDEHCILVPAPSTPFSVHQPGEVSRRLGDLVGKVSGVPVVHVLQKRSDGIVCAKPGTERVCILDDQVTRGRTLAAAGAALTGAGYTVSGAVAFSAGSTKSNGIVITPPESRGWPIVLHGATVPC